MNILRPILSTAFLLLIMTVGASTPAAAGQAPAITVELNNAKQTGQGCTLSFIFRNRLKGVIDAMSLEVVLFNKEGLVDKFLKLKTGPLPIGKLKVKQFALNGRGCADISRILINDVPDCQGTNLAPSACLRSLSVSSRAPIELVL